MLARLSSGTLLLGFGLFLCGCGGSGLGREGEVSGKVTYNGKPLSGGQVTFTTTAGYAFSSDIDAEGNYKLRPVVGEAKITVDNRMLNNKQPSPVELRRQMGMTPPAGTKADEGKSSAPAMTGTYVTLPDKYYSPDLSGLTFTVKSGKQTHDIELSSNP